MVSPNAVIGAVLAVVGVAVIAIEFVHPGALLLIPGSALLVGGLLYLFLPDILLGSVIGPIVVILVAVAAGLLELPSSRRISPGHPPMTTMPTTLIGRTGLVLVDVDPASLKGKVRIGSEVWSARAEAPIPAGTMVEVIAGEGVSVTVVPRTAGAGSPSKPAPQAPA